VAVDPELRSVEPLGSRVPSQGRPVRGALCLALGTPAHKDGDAQSCVSPSLHDFTVIRPHNLLLILHSPLYVSLNARVFLDAHFSFPCHKLDQQFLDSLGMYFCEVVFLLDVLANMVELDSAAAVGK